MSYIARLEPAQAGEPAAGVGRGDRQSRNEAENRQDQEPALESRELQTNGPDEHQTRKLQTNPQEWRVASLAERLGGARLDEQLAGRGAVRIRTRQAALRHQLAAVQEQARAQGEQCPCQAGQDVEGKFKRQAQRQIHQIRHQTNCERGHFRQAEAIQSQSG